MDSFVIEGRAAPAAAWEWIDETCSEINLRFLLVEYTVAFPRGGEFRVVKRAEPGR